MVAANWVFSSNLVNRNFQAGHKTTNYPLPCRNEHVRETDDKSRTQTENRGGGGGGGNETGE